MLIIVPLQTKIWYEKLLSDSNNFNMSSESPQWSHKKESSDKCFSLDFFGRHFSSQQKLKIKIFRFKSHQRASYLTCNKLAEVHSNNVLRCCQIFLVLFRCWCWRDLKFELIINFLFPILRQDESEEVDRQLVVKLLILFSNCK